MTEKVVNHEPSRENSILVEAIYEDDYRKPFRSCDAEVSKRCRMPALKDRIC